MTTLCQQRYVSFCFLSNKRCYVKIQKSKNGVRAEQKKRIVSGN